MILDKNVNEKQEETEEIEETEETDADKIEETTAEPEENDERNMEKEIEETMNRLIRLQADFENYKKRVARERADLIKYSTCEIMSEILPVIDNFDRAMEVEKTAETEGFYDGIDMIRKQLMEILSKSGLEEIDALGKDFNPEYHNAVSQMDSDEYDENKVMQVLQKGYKVEDRTIRPSMVIVSK